MAPARYPASSRGISLGWTNSAIEDRNSAYWAAEELQLSGQYQRLIAPRLSDNTLGHLSVFAIAPQPLLMRLGYLRSELPAVDVAQRRREPQTWQWGNHACEINYRIEQPTADLNGPVAVIFSLSATVNDSRIFAVLGADAAIWRLSIAEPDQDLIRSREHLAAFRRAARRILDKIKARPGQSALLHVFPAMPVSAAVEFGRVIQPKADLAMQIYDQQQPHGFVPALMLNSMPAAHSLRATAI